MRIIRASVRGADARRDRRVVYPLLTVRIEGLDYTSVNWSLGGMRLRGYLRRERGERISGSFQINGRGAVFLFKATVVRVDVQAGEFALNLIDLDRASYDHLDRTLAQRLARKG